MTYPTRPQFPAEEEASLARRARAGDQEARSRLLESLTALAMQCAYAVPVPAGMDRADLEQEAVLGALRAVDSYDPDRGFRLSTYAVPAIEQCLRRAIANQGDMIRVPEWRQRAGAVEARGHCRTEVLSMDAPLPGAEDARFADALPDPAPPVEEAVLRALAVDRVLERLSPMRRVALWMTAEGCSAEEAGRAVSRSRQSVFNWLRAARPMAIEEGLG